VNGPLLETEDLTVTFGGLHANDSVNLTIEEGSFVGLIGPNGAGKTTFIDAVTGFVPLSGGTVRFGGDSLNGLAPHERVDLGMSRTFQQLELFEDLSVEDNVRAAAEPTHWWDIFADLIHPRRAPKATKQIDWALETLGLSDIRSQLPSALSHGQRKLVGAARALAAEPRLVLLDEPAAGLDTTESRELGARLRTLLDHGITVFLIDHDMGLVLNVCDYIYVLDFGGLIAQGTPVEVRSNPAVISAYLGSAAVEELDL
jgi:branched-chain amino acid transport system ATP-binding protein